MRTTVVLDDDVVVAIDELRRTTGAGLSEALNLLARRGAARRSSRVVYKHRSADLGVRIDVTNVADVLELLDEDDAG